MISCRIGWGNFLISILPVFKKSEKYIKENSVKLMTTSIAASFLSFNLPGAQLETEILIVQDGGFCCAVCWAFVVRDVKCRVTAE